jgi:type III restriction enzyme
MLTLKHYQQHTLDALRVYFAACRQLGDADTAFYQVTRREWGQGIPYHPVKELPGLPYVCLRVPTGGGKTLIAAHAVGIATRELLQADRTVVLWLVPSNPIREQTLKALRDRGHPYRQALEARGSGVTVLDVAEALYVQPATLRDGTTVIVSTMQAFRVEDTEGRKVYEPSGALMGHFSGVDLTGLPNPSTSLRAEALKAEGSGQALSGLSVVDRYEDGVPVTSLANVLRLHRPVVIVDEAHNARTDLSFATLARFAPSCILEFTATPDTKTNPSNVLHSVSAAELKAEEMVKLPIQLWTNWEWKALLGDAIARRNELEQAAQRERLATGEYIRPIMLLQAQPRFKDRRTLTVDVVETCLRDDFKIAPEQIARATADDKGLEGIDLADPTCPIRYVITVQALREGWDCPFAYVLCSVAEMYASTAVEQILGRVLRLPGARRKRHAELNMAYAFAASPNFAATANGLTEALVENGFERQEVQDLIVEPPQPDLGPLFRASLEAQPLLTVAVAEAPALDRLPPAISAKVSYDLQRAELAIRERLDETEATALADCFASPVARRKVLDAIPQIRRLATGFAIRTPSERGERFGVPVLCICQGSLLEQFEESHFLEFPWELSRCDPTLTESEFPTERPEGRHAIIDVTEAGRVQTHFLDDLHAQMALFVGGEQWSEADLVLWLDRNIPHPDITLDESSVFLGLMVQQLIHSRGSLLERLVYDKFRLREAVAAKIEVHRQAARGRAFQSLLFPECDTPLVVTPDVCFEYDPNDYPCSPNSLYRGAHQFKKHYYPAVGDLKSKGEEYECAQFIDTLPEVKFWVRNLPNRPQHSFWLQISTGRFYPDFVCLLRDGRYLVVEYKGEHLYTDAEEKRIIGELWEKRSQGRCLFVMPTGRNFEVIRAKVKG